MSHRRYIPESNYLLFIIQPYSDIYSTPRLAESLENVISLGNGNNNNNNSCTTSNINNSVQNSIGTVSTINPSTSGSPLNSNSQSRYRIDALATSNSPLVTSTSITQTMDGIVDSKLRQGMYFIIYLTEIRFCTKKTATNLMHKADNKYECKFLKLFQIIYLSQQNKHKLLEI